MRLRACKVCLVLLMTGCAATPTPESVTPKSATLVPLSASPHVVEAPTVEEETLEGGPGLTPEQVSEVLINRSSLAVGGCHAVEYSGRLPEPGFVVVDLAIERSGHVRSARVAESSYQQGTLPQCVASVTRELSFPSAPGETEVSWRFDFKGR
jgi:hypothetical protein